MSDNSPANLIKATLLASIERAVNAALQSDPQSLKQLTQHANKLVAFRSRLALTNAWLLIVEEGIELYHSSAAQADITIQASPFDLASVALNRQRLASLLGNRIQVSGNQALFLQLMQIFQQLNIDWGALLSPIIGDGLAQQLDHSGRQMLGWFKETGQMLGNQLTRYLQKETGLLALRRDVYEFGQDVQELITDVEQLDSRIQRLKQTLKRQQEQLSP